MIFQNVTLGVSVENGVEKYPIVESECKIYPNSIVMGGIRIRQGSYIGAGSIITKSTEPYSVYHGLGAKFYRFRNQED